MAKAFNQRKQLLFTPQADSYVADFEQRWGVFVNVSEPFNICSNETIIIPPSCANTAQAIVDDTGGDIYSLTFSEPFFAVDNLRVTIRGRLGSTSGDSRTISLDNFSTGGGILVSLINQLCPLRLDSDFVIQIQDGAVDTIDCDSNLISGTDSPLQQLSDFNGRSTQNGWSIFGSPGLTITGVTFQTDCTDTASTTFQIVCPRNVMKALTNFPGFRYDSSTQMAYYTEDVFDAQGQFKQVTISRPVRGLLL